MPYRYPPEFRRKVLDLLAAESPGVVRRGRYEAIQTMRGEGLPTQVACRVLEVSESGFYEWRTRPPSVRSICHAWLADLIHQIHQQSRGTYGPPRVHAELRLGYGIRVGHNAEGGAHETSRPAGPERKPRTQTAANQPGGYPSGSGRGELRPPSAGPIVGDRRDRASNPRRQDLLRSRARRVQPPRRRLVHRPLRHRRATHLRPGYGDPKPPTRLGDGHPTTPGHPLHLPGVHRQAQQSGLVPSMGSVGDCFDCVIGGLNGLGSAWGTNWFYFSKVALAEAGAARNFYFDEYS